MWPKGWAQDVVDVSEKRQARITLHCMAGAQEARGANASAERTGQGRARQAPLSGSQACWAIRELLPCLGGATKCVTYSRLIASYLSWYLI